MEMILRLLLRRLMALPVMILGVTALVFVVLQFTPGDPATVALGESASEAAKQLYRESHGLNDPLFVQYSGSQSEAFAIIRIQLIGITGLIHEFFCSVSCFLPLGLIIAWIEQWRCHIEIST